jgi:hypothetical protein
LRRNKSRRGEEERRKQKGKAAIETDEEEEKENQKPGKQSVTKNKAFFPNIGRLTVNSTSCLYPSGDVGYCLLGCAANWVPSSTLWRNKRSVRLWKGT